MLRNLFVICLIAFASAISLAACAPITEQTSPNSDEMKSYSIAIHDFSAGNWWYGEDLEMNDGRLPILKVALRSLDREVVHDKQIDVKFLRAIYVKTDPESTATLLKRLDRNPEGFACEVKLLEGEHDTIMSRGDILNTGKWEHFYGQWSADTCEWKKFEFEKGITNTLLHLRNAVEVKSGAYSDLWIPKKVGH